MIMSASDECGFYFKYMPSSRNKDEALLDVRRLE